MEGKKHVARPRPPKQSPNKRKLTIEGFLEQIHRPHTFSLRSLLRSFFSCSRYSGECADEQVTCNDNVIKRPRDAKKKKRVKHTASKAPQVQHGSLNVLTSGSKKWEADHSGKDCTSNVFFDTEKQEIQKQELPLPNISEPSTIMSEALQSSLGIHLPILVRGREWVLLYSTWKHGISLLTLYHRSARLSGPCLLVVEDSKGAVFGGLLTGPLNPSVKPKYQGTHESFVFTNVDTNFELFRPTGLNRYYFLCTNDMLAIGGGSAFALQIDGDLMHGTSGLSETFGNCCLSYTQEFSIRHVELWGFAHKSKYMPEKAAYESPGISRL